MKISIPKLLLLAVALIGLMFLFEACRCTLGDNFTFINFEIENQHENNVQIIVQYFYRPNPEDRRDTLSLAPNSFLVLETRMPITSCGDNAKEALEKIEHSFVELAIIENTGKVYKNDPLLMVNWEKQYINRDSSKVRLVLLTEDFE